MNNIITLVVGDPSGDGHRETDTFTIKTNLSKQELTKAYEKGSKLLGFDFKEHICCEYEDSILPEEELNILLGKDLILKDIVDDYFLQKYKNSGILNLDSDSYTNIFLFIVKLGNSEFEYTYEKLPTIDIGGYGLFF